MKNIIISGCSSGFGYLMAQDLAREGHTIYATMRNIHTSNKEHAEKLSQWAADEHLNIRVLEMDVSSNISVNHAITDIAKQAGGRIDVMINNAGSGIIGLMEELSDEEYNNIFQTMAIGSVRTNNAVLPYMHQLGEGLLIQISSRISSFQVPFMGLYSAAKAASHAFAKTYNFELKVAGIDSVVVQAGPFKTEISNKRRIIEDEAIRPLYGEWYNKVKPAVMNMVGATETAHHPAEMTSLVSRIIGTPFGEREMVYTIGLDQMENPIGQINQLSKSISELVIKKAEA